MVALILGSLFFTRPAPLDMPRAEAYLTRDGEGVSRLEDRYECTDLWISQNLVGRWEDSEGRVFSLFRVRYAPPAEAGGTLTRCEAAERRRRPERREERPLLNALEIVSPVEPAEEFARPRQSLHGYRDVRYYQGTNCSAVVCAYRREKETVWSVATWELAEGDAYADMVDAFEDKFLLEGRGYTAWPEKEPEKLPARRKGARSDERELLREDLRRSVAAYPSWHFASSPEFVVIDDMKSGRGVIGAITNELPALRGRFAAVLPTPVDGSNTLAVARIYATREEYLAAAGEDMAWSAAYWNQERRELVAYLPEGGTEELKRTFRHESFHQYLSYAASMIQTSPWLNEGYAQYFEDEKGTDFGMPVDFEKAAEALPAVFAMDYAQFYDGTDLERRFKYRLAWSVAVFLEKGAHKVRFQPFRNLKRDYFKSLLDTHDMRKATAAAFGSTEKLADFVDEWKKFWTDR